MPQQLKRLLVAFAIFIALFLVTRHLLRPKSFGEKGHYRILATAENINHPRQYAGRAGCIQCHDTVQAEKKDGHHAPLNCEGCHGPGLKHATFAGKYKKGTLPDSLKRNKPTERKFCAICHNKNAARIKIKNDTINNSMIHQVNVMEHNLKDEDTKAEHKCIDCHNPHQP